MRAFLLVVILLCQCGPLRLAVANYVPPQKSLDFPVYKNKPSGKQLTGQHVPATTPALSPEEAQRRFRLPPGFEIRLFASEPEVVNPVAMTWDERGRLWVVELYEYPLGAPNGQTPRDRIKILEDTDADGHADKVTVFADGLNLATGILLGYGGVFVGQAPDLLFLEDTDGDGKADKRTVLKTGFGLQDRHELLNGFTWGPDGWLYLTHGVFTQSQVKDPANPTDDGVVVNAAVARYHPRTKKFEVFADGTSNPWGVDFDRYGNAFVSACVIDHLFHMAPGGLYLRQGGTWANPYAYADLHSPRGGLPSIADHRHHMAAYSGVQVYQGDQYPAEHRGTILMGNIHANAVHQDVLTPDGSSFKASFKQDFVVANDGWFMPISEQVGPDGCLWVMDWYDKYPCYQNARADPDGVDREHGRIWRVVFTGGESGKPVPSRPQRDMDLAKRTGAELVKLLEHPNSWHRRMAQRLLSERRDTQVRPVLEKLLAEGKTLESRLAALWTLHGSEQLSEQSLYRLREDKEPAMRAWLARLIGERGEASDRALQILAGLAADRDPSVRLAVATATRQFVSGSLTVNTPVAPKLRGTDISAIRTALLKSSADSKDSVLPFLIWMAIEPGVAAAPQAALDWLAANGPATLPLSAHLTTKVMRRICDLRQPALLNQAVAFVGREARETPALALAALDGLIEGQKGKALTPAADTSTVLNALLGSDNPALRERAQRLGTLWGNAAAIQTSVRLVNDASASVADRLTAIEVVRKLKNDAAREAMLTLISQRNAEPLVIAALQALGEIGGDTLAGEIVKRWKNFTPAVRRSAAEMLASRDRWASSLLSALEGKEIAVADIPATAIRTVSRSKADFGMLAKRAAQVFGKVRDADQDKLKIIAARKQMILGHPGKLDLKAGHEIAQKTCLTCHKLHGEGADVGPDLTGVGRATLDALLANIIDPNQIIGAGYENVEIETKDGRLVSGRMVENSDARVRLLAAGPKEEVVSKSDIGSLRVSELSVMPEGLEQMPDADFRNLIAFILNPPGDKQPFSWKNEGGQQHGAGAAPTLKPKSSNQYPAVDWESVSLWNPEWKVSTPDFQGTPRKLVEFADRKNVLMTHPYSREKACALERVIDVPAGRKVALAFAVAAHDKGDWELRVLADGQLLHKQLVDKTGERWKPVNVDLTPLAGKKITLRLENAANGWAWEFGYWSDVRLVMETVKTAR